MVPPASPTTSMTKPTRRFLPLPHAVIAALLCFACLAPSLTAQTKSANGDAPKSFAIGSGDATVTLKQFAQQSGVELLYSADVVQGIKTQPVQGELPPREALERMLAGTELVATQGRRTGAYAVRKQTPEEAKNVQSRKSSVLFRDGCPWWAALRTFWSESRCFRRCFPRLCTRAVKSLERMRVGIGHFGAADSLHLLQKLIP